MIQSSGSTHLVRNDIEGLRAIAVLAVLVHHLQPFALRGGFVGVDIFLVISGYLIGKHLLQDIQQGKFSFLQFYGRRARRILPALSVMLVTVWVVGWIILSGPEFVDLGRHIVAAALFSNNVLLWSQSGYFDAPAATKPLLHLWSLGVEEQFYLLVPFLLWLGSVGRRPSVRWVLRLSAVSLLLTVIYAEPSFYLLDTRFWELGVGVAIGYLSLYGPFLHGGKRSLGTRHYLEFIAFSILLMLCTALSYLAREHPWNRFTIITSSGLIALFVMAVIFAQLVSAYREPSTWERLRGRWQRHEHRIREILSASGAVLIGASLIAITSDGWPGPQTFFAVLGTALLIVAGSGTWTNRILAWPPLAFIGGISYPLYLWHWPAIVFWRMFGFDTNLLGKLTPALIAVLLAWLTKELIENPVRFGKLGTWAVPIPRVRVLSAGMLIAGLIGASTIAAGGFPVRFAPSLRAIANWSMPLPDNDWRPRRCFFAPGIADEFAAECTPPKQSGIHQILLWGDSHAAHLYPGLASLQAKHNFGIVQWTSAACPPVRKPLANEDPTCAKRRARAIQEIKQVAPDTVLLSAAWEMYLANGNSEGQILAATEDDILWLLESGVRRIILFGPVPTWSTSSDIFMFMLRKRLEHIPERLGEVSSGIHHLDAAMAAQAAAAHVEYVSVVDQFCDARGCLVIGDRNVAQPDLLFRDRDHLTVSGSRLLMQAAVPQIFGRQ